MFEPGTPDCERGVRLTPCELQYKRRKRDDEEDREEELKYTRKGKNKKNDELIVPISSLYVRHMAQQPLGGQRLLIIKNSLSHYINTPHFVGLLWTTDQPDAETST
jgi:hypothetical protein